MNPLSTRPRILNSSSTVSLLNNRRTIHRPARTFSHPNIFRQHGRLEITLISRRTRQKLQVRRQPMTLTMITQQVNSSSTPRRTHRQHQHSRRLHVQRTLISRINRRHNTSLLLSSPNPNRVNLTRRRTRPRPRHNTQLQTRSHHNSRTSRRERNMNQVSSRSQTSQRQ